MSIRVIELATKLEVETSDLIAVCVLLQIQANTRISCLSREQEQVLINYYKNNYK